jgi:putative transposase
MKSRWVAQMVALAPAYGRYGYRRITALLRQAGWRVNAKRIERLWRREGLNVPARQSKRGRLWLNQGSCVRLRPAYPNHVWAYDFVHERTHDGRALRMLTVVDEYTRECLAIRVARRLTSEDVLQQLTALFVARGTPAYLRSDNGPELTAAAVREWLARVGVTTLFIEPGSPWENGYCPLPEPGEEHQRLANKIAIVVGAWTRARRHGCGAAALVTERRRAGRRAGQRAGRGEHRKPH